MRVINRLAPLSYENLTGYMERLRLANHYDEMGWYRHATGLNFDKRLHLIRSNADFLALAELTGLSIDKLYNMTLHRFVACFYNEVDLKAQESAREYDDIDRPLWTSTGLGTHVLGQSRVCPLCWLEHRTLMLPWMLRYVTTCPEHQVLLMDICTGCNTRLSVNIATGACGKCGKSVAAIATPAIEGHRESMELSRLVWAAINCSDEEFPPTDLGLMAEHPLYELTPQQFIYFMHAFSGIVFSRDPGNPIFDPALMLPGTAWARPPKLLRAATVSERHIILTAIWRMLRDWPDSWRVTLARMAEKEAKLPTAHRLPKKLVREFAGPGWEWLHSEWRGFIQDNAGEKGDVYPWFRHYRKANGNQATSLLTQREAARELRVSNNTVKGYMARRVVSVTADPAEGVGGKRRWRLIDRESVMRLAQERIAMLTLDQAAAYCGVADRQVVTLVAAGLLQAEHGPLADGESIWRFSQGTLEQGVGAITATLAQHTPDADGYRLSLDEAVRLGSFQGVGMAVLLVAVKDGSLPASIDPGVGGLRGVGFSKREIAAFLERRKERADGRVLYSVHDVCRILVCKPTTLRRLYAAGLLVPCIDRTVGKQVRWEYDSRDVEAYQARYINTDQAASLLNLHRVTVETWARTGRLPAVTGPSLDGSHFYRFDRDALVAWRAERLTYGEAVAIFDVDKSTFNRWVRLGRVRKLSPPEQKGNTWYSREDVERIKAEREQKPPPSEH